MSSNTLPPEIWLKIFQHQTTPDLYPMLLSSKSFYALVKEEMYKEISLASPRNIVKFLLHIKKNDNVAQKVLSLRFNHRHMLYVNDNHLGSIFRLSQTTLPRLVNLRILRLYGVPRNRNATLNPYYFSNILNDCTFPHLRIFETDVMLMPETIDDFLIRHQNTIEVLSLRSAWHGIFSIEPPVTCGKLVTFMGLPFLVGYWLRMIDTPVLQRVVVYVGLKDELGRLLEDIGQLPVGTRELEFRAYGEVKGADIQDEISRHPFDVEVVEVTEAFD
ncbi:hypothetical protein VNI00_007283 [Paramarasmius palmivorus]|uniref:F-box domain-containing protein n=1 Tax=Paramarasmius palmivorus TaxID=297713 RepID=A0AAW0D2Q8_9AGAR